MSAKPRPSRVLAVASANPVKLEAARSGYLHLFPEHRCQTRAVRVPSGVSDQPTSDDEARRGAEQRATAARSAEPGADYWLGIEGGIVDDGETMNAFAWVVVLSRDGRRGLSRSASFELPPSVAALVRSGLELGDADDRVFGTEGSKRRGGAVGFLTGGAIDRAALYAHAVSLALVPFKTPAHFPS